MHTEASTTAGLKQLKSAAPDAATTALQTANLQSSAAGEKVIAEFNTAAGVPGVAGKIPIGATISATVWMRKTANLGAMVPRLKIRLDSATGTLLCSATGTTALTTTVTAYALSCPTTAVITTTATSRLYVWAGVNLTTTASSGAFRGELNIEGTAGGNYDSTVTIPNALPAPTIASLTPSSGGIGTVVTIVGTNFRDQQLNSTVTFFNNRTATVTSWSNTSIVATVPTGTTTGAVRVTVAGTASTTATFTIVAPPTITSLTPSSGGVGASITIAGTNFGATQGTSVIRFNGVTVTTTAWSATSITALVPVGAATGTVTVTVAGQTSAGRAFTVIPPPTLTAVAPATAQVGASVVVSGSNFGAAPGTSSVRFNGTVAATTAWSATAVTATVPAGATTGPVTVTVAGQTSNGLPFDVVPTFALTSVTPSSAAVWSVVTLTGTGFGGAQGSSVVTFNGAVATPSLWSPTAITLRVPPDATDGPVVVWVDEVDSNGVVFDVIPATPLTVTPSYTTLAVGDSRVLSARTDTGQPAASVTWSSSNPAAVSVSSTVAGQITAEALGQATITAISGGLTATAAVRVLPNGVNIGEPTWSTLPTPGRTISQVMAANPVTDDDPSLFSIEPAPDGSSFLVRGIREADGVNVWSASVAQVMGADKFGGVLAIENLPGGSGGYGLQALRRMGGTTVPDWSYVVDGFIASATAADNGVVYALEAALTTATPNTPYYDSQGYVVGLDAASGQVLFRHPLPTSWQCSVYSWLPGEPLVQQTQWSSGFSAIVALPNGDAAFQWKQGLTNLQCPNAPQFDDTLSLTRVTPTGTVSSDVLRTWTYSGELYPPTATTGQVRPDGLGGALATWGLAAQDTGIVPSISRVASGSVVTRAAPWNDPWSDSFEQRTMVTSDGVVILPEGPNRELVVRAVDTWAIITSLPVAGAPVTVLEDGGIVVLINGALHTYQADGTLAFSDPTPISSSLTIAAEDVLYGLDATTGAVEQIKMRSERRSVWTFLRDVFAGCTPGVLFADLPAPPVTQIGLVARLLPYVYDFKFDNADPALNVWTSDQQLGVDDAFQRWTDLGPMIAKTTGETVTFEKRTTPGSEVDIWVTKHDFAADDPLRPQVTGRFNETPPLPGLRITGGTIRLSNLATNISIRKGFRRATLHEVAHALGLAHPNATPAQPFGDPAWKAYRAGGTVLNDLGRVRPSLSGDDSANRVADRPTRCDIDAARAALRR